MSDTPFREMPRTLVMPSATSPRTARPTGGDGVTVTHGDRETCIMSCMDGSTRKPILVPELMAEIEARALGATLEGAGA